MVGPGPPVPPPRPREVGAEGCFTCLGAAFPPLSAAGASWLRWRRPREVSFGKFAMPATTASHEADRLPRRQKSTDNAPPQPNESERQPPQREIEKIHKCARSLGCQPGNHNATGGSMVSGSGLLKPSEKPHSSPRAPQSKRDKIHTCVGVLGRQHGRHKRHEEV